MIPSGRVVGVDLPERVGEVLPLDDGLRGDLPSHLLVLALAQLELVELVAVGPSDRELILSAGFIRAGEHGRP